MRPGRGAWRGGTSRPPGRGGNRPRGKARSAARNGRENGLAGRAARRRRCRSRGAVVLERHSSARRGLVNTTISTGRRLEGKLNTVSVPMPTAAYAPYAGGNEP